MWEEMYVERQKVKEEKRSGLLPEKREGKKKKKLKNGRLVNNSSNRSDFDISARIKYLTSNFFSFLSPWRWLVSAENPQLSETRKWQMMIPTLYFFVWDRYFLF